MDSLLCSYQHDPKGTSGEEGGSTLHRLQKTRRSYPGVQYLLTGVTGQYANNGSQIQTDTEDGTAEV